MKNQPERLNERGAHIVAAGGQDVSELCECEEWFIHARCILFDLLPDEVEKEVLAAREKTPSCDRCPRGKS